MATFVPSISMNEWIDGRCPLLSLNFFPKVEIGDRCAHRRRLAAVPRRPFPWPLALVAAGEINQPDPINNPTGEKNKKRIGERLQPLILGRWHQTTCLTRSHFGNFPSSQHPIFSIKKRRNLNNKLAGWLGGRI